MFLGGDQSNLNGSARNELWKVLKQNIPKIPLKFQLGRKDFSGNSITNYEGLKRILFENIYAQAPKLTYKNRINRN